MDWLLMDQNMLLLLLVVLWVLPWKAVALWKAARLGHKGWFIALIIVNSLAILEIIYIFLVASKYKVETIEEEAAEEQIPDEEN